MSFICRNGELQSRIAHRRQMESGFPGANHLRSSIEVEDFMNHAAMNIGQTPIDSAMTKSELFVIDPQKVQQRRVKIIGVGHVLNGFPGPLVTLAERRARFYPGTGKPGDERASVVVSTGRALTKRHATKLSGPDQKSVI